MKFYGTSYKQFVFTKQYNPGEYYSERRFFEDFREWLGEQKIYVEPYIIDETKEFFRVDNCATETFGIKFIARPRTEDDDLREQIEYMIKNING